MACMFFLCNLISKVLTANPLHDTVDLKTCVKRCQALTDSMKRIVSSYEVEQDIERFRKKHFVDTGLYALNGFSYDEAILKEQVILVVQSIKSAERKMNVSDSMVEFEGILSEFITILNSRDVSYIGSTAIILLFNAIQYRLCDMYIILILYKSIDQCAKTCNETINDPLVTEKTAVVMQNFNCLANIVENFSKQWTYDRNVQKEEFLKCAISFENDLSVKLAKTETLQDRLTKYEDFKNLCLSLKKTFSHSEMFFIGIDEFRSEPSNKTFATELILTFNTLLSYDKVCAEAFAKESAKCLSAFNIRSSKSYKTKILKISTKLQFFVEYHETKWNEGLSFYEKMFFDDKEKNEATCLIVQFKQEIKTFLENYKNVFEIVKNITAGETAIYKRTRYFASDNDCDVLRSESDSD